MISTGQAVWPARQDNQQCLQLGKQFGLLHLVANQWHRLQQVDFSLNDWETAEQAMYRLLTLWVYSTSDIIYFNFWMWITLTSILLA